MSKMTDFFGQTKTRQGKANWRAITSKKLAQNGISWAEFRRDPFSLYAIERDSLKWFIGNFGQQRNILWYGNDLNIPELLQTHYPALYSDIKKSDPHLKWFEGETESPSEETRGEDPSLVESSFGETAEGVGTNTSATTSTGAKSKSRTTTSDQKPASRNEGKTVPTQSAIGEGAPSQEASGNVGNPVGTTETGTTHQSTNIATPATEHQVDAPQGTQHNTKGTLQGESGNRKIQKRRGAVFGIIEMLSLVDQIENGLILPIRQLTRSKKYDLKTAHYYDMMNTELISLPYDHPTFKLSEDNARDFTRRFNTLKMYSYVISFQELSSSSPIDIAYSGFVENMCYIFEGGKFTNKVKDLLFNQKWLCIGETSDLRGHHLHAIFYSNQTIRKNKLNDLQETLENLSLHYIEDNQSLHPVVTYQEIKSNASFINYLKKDPLYIISNDINLIKMFINFERTHIFDKDSFPKKKRRITEDVTIASNNPLVIFFTKKLHEGVHDFTVVNQDKNIEPYLGDPKLKSIWDNCYLNYTSKFTHIKVLHHIVDKFLRLPIDKHCACAAFEWFRFQNININTALEYIGKWLNGCEKRNALYFIGAANTGKSQFARLISNQFPIVGRLSQDGIFTFANLINASVGVWEEPFIGPDMVDTTKEVLEGYPQTKITIKNKSSMILNKRVPIIITSNKPIEKYVSGDAAALNARCYRFDFNQTINPSTFKFCNNDVHYCPHLDTTNCTFTEFTYADLQKVCERSRETSSEYETCENIHPITDSSILTLLVFALYKLPTLKRIEGGSNQEHLDLLRKLQTAEKSICFPTKNFQQFEHEYC